MADNGLSLPKLFVDIENLEKFYSLKRAVSKTNDTYITGKDGAITSGEPDIRWEQICYIMAEKLIYTRGVMFCKNTSSGGGSNINDDITDLDSTWSSEKIQKELSKYRPVSKTPDNTPTVYFDGVLPNAKAQGEYKSSCHIKGLSTDIDCYASLKVQGDSSTAYNKKNFTIKFFKDEECKNKLKINFGWGAQYKYVMKANWIDITHSRNVVSAQLWGDVVSSREDYETLPELLRTSPNNGAIDGFPIRFYGNNVYWGRYTMNIPKDAWMTNMDSDNPQHLILCGENYNEALFRAPARWDESDWTDELHDEVPAELLARFNELVSFVMNSSDEEFKANLGNYVDIQSVLDYYIFGLLICNLDGFGKNHIWLSYDGNKFIASAYDMDSTFGLYWNGTRLLSSSYKRSEFEDMVNGDGNLLYNRLVQNFLPELTDTYNRLVKGPMSFNNVLNHFNSFIDITPYTLVQEDWANTTGNGSCTNIPSKTSNNIQQIRSWYASRIIFVRDNIGALKEDITEPNPPDQPENPNIPDPFAVWEDEEFDGNDTLHAPINTTYQLFSDSDEWKNWTLFVHAKIESNSDLYRMCCIHCMEENTAETPGYPGIVMQIQGNNGQIDTNKCEIRTKNLNSNSMVSTWGAAAAAEQYIAIQKEGNVMKYSTDGTNWTTISGVAVTHNNPLIIGGYCSEKGEVLNGAQGREIVGHITVRLWKELPTDISTYFSKKFITNS